jgi:hypothetical protein
MREKIENFLKEKSELRNELKQFVQDKSKPLNERWEIFVQSELGEKKSYFETFDHKIGEKYVDLLEDKYSTHTVKNILDTIDDLNEEENWNFTDEDINSFKEKVLEKFIWSFKFDW